MKETSVEWLVDQFEKTVFYSEEAKENTIKQAKEMEEQQQDNFAIEFAEWIRINDFQTTSKDNWIGLDMEYYTTKELLEIFKKNKI